MFEALIGWFRRIPVKDPVDRRNAMFMQGLLLFEGVRTPLNKAYMLLFDWSYLQSTYYQSAKVSTHAAVSIDLGTDLAMTIAAWLGVGLIRAGHFRLAVAQYLAVVLASGLLAYASFGFLLGASSDEIMVVVLALAGLMLGRRALWLSYGAIMLTFAVGMLSNYYFNLRTFASMGPFGELPTLALDYVQIAVILDLSVISLRKGLEETNSQRLALQHEVIERERTQEQLLHAQKMDAVGKLTSGIAHDLNTVFEVVLGFTTERDRIDDDTPCQDADTLALANAIDGIELAARRGSDLCRKLLQFGRSDATHVETFDAGTVLHELEPLLRNLFSKAVSLKLDVSDTPVRIHFDRSQFELALLTIAANARDAMPDGGACIISLSRSSGAQMILSITDTGIGMIESVRRRIFEPFFTTKPSGRGTGLGLALVNKLFESGGGHVEVRSNPATGTTLTISLPIS